MYETEQFLVNDIKNLIAKGAGSVPNDLKMEHQLILTEVNLGYGVADIVLTEYEEMSEIREDYMTTVDIILYRLISMSSGLSVNEACDATRCDRKKIEKSVRKLVDLDYIECTNDTLIFTRAYRKTVKQSVAIEAKLKNWQRALKQAYRYRWFSDRSFVCLPENNLEPAIKNVSSFKKLNVGLLGMNSEEGMTVVYMPEPSQPISEDMSILLNESVLSEVNGFLETTPRLQGDNRYFRHKDKRC